MDLLSDAQGGWAEENFPGPSATAGDRPSSGMSMILSRSGVLRCQASGRSQRRRAPAGRDRVLDTSSPRHGS